MAIEYRGISFPGYNRPIKSNRAGKKKMVLAKEGNKVRLIHFGATGYPSNYSAEARAAYKKRHAKNIKGGKLTAGHWAYHHLWKKGSPVYKPKKGDKNLKGVRKKK